MKMTATAFKGTDVWPGGLHPQHFCCIYTQIFNDLQRRQFRRLFLL
jgi:hypothetical protein